MPPDSLAYLLALSPPPQVNSSKDALNSGECLRVIVHIRESQFEQVGGDFIPAGSNSISFFIVLNFTRFVTEFLDPMFLMQAKLPKLKGNMKVEGGFMKQLSH